MGGGTPFSDKTISRQKFRDTVHLRVTHQPIAHPYSTLINDMILVHPVPFMPHFQQHLAISYHSWHWMHWLSSSRISGISQPLKKGWVLRRFFEGLSFDIRKFPKSWGLPLVIIHFNRIVHYKPSILGYLHLWNPYMFLSSFWISSA